MNVHEVHGSRRSLGCALRAGTYLVVFVIAGLAACTAEFLKARRTSRYVATAFVTVPEAWFQAPVEPQTPTSLVDLAVIEREIASEGVSSEVRVSVCDGSSDVVRVAISHTATEASVAIRLANRSAEGFAARQRAGVARELRRQVCELVAAEECSHRRLQDVRSDLGALLDRAATALAASPGPSPEATARPLKPEPSPPPDEQRPTPTGTPGDDPRVAEARAQLQDLQGRRQKLLLERTPAHPEVQQIDVQIADAERQLSAVRSLIASDAPGRLQGGREAGRNRTGPEAKTPTSVPPGQPVSSAPPVAGLMETLRMLNRWLDGTDCPARAGTANVQAALRCLERGDLQVEPADHAEVVSGRFDRWDWMLVALAAGLVGTAGVGLIWTGLRVDSALRRVRDVERSLGLRALGPVPVLWPPSSDGPRPSRPDRWRRPCLVAGAVVGVLYLAFLLMPLVAG